MNVIEKAAKGEFLTTEDLRNLSNYEIKVHPKVAEFFKKLIKHENYDNSVTDYLSMLTQQEINRGADKGGRK